MLFNAWMLELVCGLQDFSHLQEAEFSQTHGFSVFVPSWSPVGPYRHIYIYDTKGQTESPEPHESDRKIQKADRRNTSFPASGGVMSYAPKAFVLWRCWNRPVCETEGARSTDVSRNFNNFEVQEHLTWTSVAQATKDAPLGAPPAPRLRPVHHQAYGGRKIAVVSVCGPSNSGKSAWAAVSGRL